MLAVFWTLPYTASVRETPVCHISVVYLRTLAIKVTRFLYTRVKIKRHKWKHSHRHSETELKWGTVKLFLLSNFCTRPQPLIFCHWTPRRASAIQQAADQIKTIWPKSELSNTMERSLHYTQCVFKEGTPLTFSLPFPSCLWLQASPLSLLSPAAHCLSPQGSGNDPPDRQETDCEYEYTWCAMVHEFLALPLNTAKASVRHFGCRCPSNKCQCREGMGVSVARCCSQCANLILSGTAGKGRCGACFVHFVSIFLTDQGQVIVDLEGNWSEDPYPFHFDMILCATIIIYFCDCETKYMLGYVNDRIALISKSFELGMIIAITELYSLYLFNRPCPSFNLQGYEEAKSSKAILYYKFF